MPTLPLPGAELYYESVGSGPLFLCISGAKGSKEDWDGLASQLKAHFTVVSYDRRGHSRSYLSMTTGQDYSCRLATDADDAARLIEHLSPGGEPATVMGSSSGAMVALELLSRHANVVRTLIPHEPPALKLLPNFSELSAKQQDIYDIYRAQGIPPALEMFGEAINAGAEAKFLPFAFDPKSGPFASSNVIYWFERELMFYPFRDFEADLQEDGGLKAHQDRLLLVRGRDSEKDAPQYIANACLKEKLGMEQPVLELPGAHFGYGVFPEAFAKELMHALQEKDSHYAGK